MSEPQPRKKKKVMCVYLKKWEEKFDWLISVSESDSKAFCKLCRREFSIAHGGLADVTQHSKGEKHQVKVREAVSTSNMRNFFTVNTTEADSVTAVEVTQVYHTVSHNHSYNSMDCSNKLLVELFNDSKVAKKLSCGRTKGEMIAKNILAPKSIEDFLLIMQNEDEESQKKFFSIATDASNKGNRKMFPLCIRYFDPSTGVQTKLLDFFEEANESAQSIYDNLTERLKKHKLPLDNVAAYSINTNVNYGKHKSVYKLLCDNNPRILKANCSAHVLHNACKHACDKLDFDIETFVLKVYSHFSVSAKRRAELQSFFEFIDLEWSEILRHVSTRWLSLTPAVDRLIKNWPALTSYFKSTEDIPKLLKKIFNDDDDEKVNEVEAYLHFFSNIGSVLQKTIMTLEGEKLSIIESYEAVTQLHKQIEQRIEDKFIGHRSKNLVETFLVPEKKKIMTDFENFYKCILNYVEKWTDLSENNVMQKLKALTLRDKNKKIQYNDFEEAVNILKLQNTVDMDVLYEEFSVIKESLHMAPEQFSTLSDTEKWVNIFKIHNKGNLPNMLTLMSFIFSAPGSNAFVERVFSLMNNKWTDVRNRCSVDLIKSELQIVINFNHMQCREFFKLVKSDRKLLQKARSMEKYDHQN